jgi:C-terminal domain of tail specific protease (DUF3340)
LRAKSAQRVATAKGFAWIRDEITLRKATLATKSVSLNEAERRTEMARLAARKKSHMQELAAMAGQGPRTYEISLENADRPGLPQPLRVPADKEEPKDTANDDVPSASDQDVIMNEAQRILADYVSMETTAAPGFTLGHEPGRRGVISPSLAVARLA